MGIDARLENGRGEVLAQVADPAGHVNWLFSLADLNGTICLRFVDPYGDSLFNTMQLPILRKELDWLAQYVTEANLRTAQEDYLTRAATWPARAIADAGKYASSLSDAALRSHLSRLLTLTEDALARGPHHYVRFIGD